MGKTHKEFVDLIVDYVRSDFPDPLAKSKKYFYEYEKAVINDGMKIRAIADYRAKIWKTISILLAKLKQADTH